jgi:hypothetical protein
MLKIPVLAIILVTGLAACQAKKPEPGADAQAQPAIATSAEAAPEIGWLEADGPGEAAIEWPSSEEGKPGFMISCSKEGSLFRVSVPDPGASTTPTANESTAMLSFDEAKFPVTVLVSQIVGPHLDGEIPLTPQLLAAIAKAQRARLDTPGGRFETQIDTQGKLAAFVADCSALTGVQPAPPSQGSPP